MTLVLSDGYVSTRGRKPTRAAFLYDFHNDDAGGTAVVDRFGNAADLTLAGTLGTAWTNSRGWWRPGGSDTQAVTAAGGLQDYAPQTVGDILTVGNGVVFAWRIGWNGTKSTTTERVLCMGRQNSTSSCFALGHNPTTGIVTAFLRGTGASSATTEVTFGATGNYSASADISIAVHVEATADGVVLNCFKDGASIGTQQTLLWTALGGVKPASSIWAYPDGLTIGARRAGTSGSPTHEQRVGAGTSGGTRLANVLGVNLGAANLTTAADLALELHQNPRFVGEILAAL